MADQPKKQSESHPANATDQTDQTDSSRVADDTLIGDQTPLKSGVDLLATSDRKQSFGTLHSLDSDESTGASETIASAYPEEAESDLYNEMDDQNSEDLGQVDQNPDGFDPVRPDTESGVDLLAVSTYPDGSTRLGPEDSAELFDSLVSDERSDADSGDVVSEDRGDDYELEPETDFSTDQSTSLSDELHSDIVEANSASQVNHDFSDELNDHEVVADSENVQDKGSEWADESSDLLPEGIGADSTELEELGGQNFEESLGTLERKMQADEDNEAGYADLVDDVGENIQLSETHLKTGSVDESMAAGSEFNRDSNGAVAQAYGWAEVDELEDDSGSDDNSEDIQDDPFEASGSGYSEPEDKEQGSGQRQSQAGAPTAQASVLTYDNMLEEDEQMRWFTIGIPILLVAIIIIMGGYVYSLQSQIDEIHTLMSAEDDDFFNEDGEDGAGQVDGSALAHVNSRIDNLAASVEAIANQSGISDAQGTGESSPSNGLVNVNKDLAILAERLGNVEQKLSSQKSVPQMAIKPKARANSKPKPTKPVVTANKSKSSNSAAGKTGIWSVNLMSVTEKSDADKQLKGFRQKGVAAEIQPKMISGKQWYRVQVTGFESKKEAREYAGQVKNKLGLASVWVTK